MITREAFSATELDVAGDDAATFFDWLNRAGLLQFAPSTGWRWEDRAEAAPTCPMDVLDLWAQFREEAQTMTTTILSTRVWGNTYAVRANWAQASDQVQALDADGDWIATGHQVADYRHSAEAALRAQMELSAIACGPFDDAARAEIEAAMKQATPEADG